MHHHTDDNDNDDAHVKVVDLFYEDDYHDVSDGVTFVCFKTPLSWAIIKIYQNLLDYY